MGLSGRGGALWPSLRWSLAYLQSRILRRRAPARPSLQPQDDPQVLHSLAIFERAVVEGGKLLKPCHVRCIMHKSAC